MKRRQGETETRGKGDTVTPPQRGLCPGGNRRHGKNLRFPASPILRFDSSPLRRFPDSEKERGFTLIELLIVIAVISILVAIVIPNFRGIRIQAKNATAKANLRNLQTALLIYMKWHNCYPDTLGDLATEAKEKRIVNKIPDDPFNEDNEYQYDTDGAGEWATYVVWSIGPDGADNITGCGDDTLDAAPDDDIYVTNAVTIP